MTRADSGRSNTVLATSVNDLTKASQVSKSALKSASYAKTRYVVVPAKQIPFPVRSSFLLLAFALPFQASDLVFTSGSLSLAKLSGLLFFAFYCFYNNPLFRKRSHPPRALWWFLGYVVVYALNGFFVSAEFFDEFRSGLITLVQLIFLFWCACDLFNDTKLGKRFLLVFSIATVMFALGIILNVPGFSVSVQANRITALGNNPNAVAGLMALAGVSLAGLYLSGGFKNTVSKMWLIALILPLLAAMVETGSRGGTLAFMAGCLVYSVPLLNSKRKALAMFLVLLLVGVVAYLVVSSPVFVERIQQTYEDRSLAGREDIYPAALELILERPIFGWHPVDFTYELGARGGLGEFSDPHNLILHLLMEGGLVAAVPFLVGVGLCGKAAWKARSGNLGLLPLALVITILMTNMSGTYHVLKEFWIVMAIAITAQSRSRTTVTDSSRYLFKNVPARPGRS